jgi:hypothetical protein
MTDAMSSPSPGRELAARERDGRTAAMLDASGRSLVAKRTPQQLTVKWFVAGRKRPRRARSHIRTREIVASVI